ncbi:MAG: putative nucleotidyltransferase substrate binding domain-containing protein [Burkholderiaceae bacterium]|nr:putative nucleotidyltransferase substrate binding domain-containing protein [Burkholderiaceae bacterium]
MPNAFNFSASPFDCLNPDEQRLVRSSVDIVYFREGETILDVGIAPTHLFVVIKGFVTQREGDEVITTYGPDDSFDGRGLVAGKVSSKFIAAEEVVAYQLARQAVSDLIASNDTFGALLFSDLGNKLSALSQRKSRHELQALTLSRVDEAFLRPAHFVDATTDILSVVKLFQQHRTSSVLVRDTQSEPPRLGIFTATALQRAILDGRPLDRLAVGELTSYSLIEVRPSDQLGDAMAVMLRRRVHRVVVAERGKVVGILEALDLFSFLSNQSHLITVQIEEAKDLAGLSQAAAQITRMITLLYRSGSRVNLIAKLVQQLNARLFERAWQLIAPIDLVANSCLFVMGSEGRGEQLLKTDQDNGLILRDGYVYPDNLATICQRFSSALSEFGYPECPGHIMVNNLQWRKSATEFGQMTRQWLLLPDGDSLMNLAIFMDAHTVCGDASLLEGVQRGLMALATDNDAMLNRFAAAIDSFGNSTGWWNRLLGLGDAEQQLNLKKEGIFPLVHGVRSLALAHRVIETSTVGRISALVAGGKLDAAMGTDLTDSLYFFMGLKLKAGLAELDTGKPVSGAIEVGRLSSLDRDLLKDTLGVVKRFKALLRHRFHLEAM